MVKTASTMLPLGTTAPDFSLPDVNGKTISLSDYQGKKGLVVIFMCNHCPFVIHLASALSAFGKEYQDKGFGVVGISSNDVANYPQDSPDLMAVEAQKQGYTFEYLYDESQAVAHAYKAACTPDFYLFDGDLKLVYRGQFDSSRPGNDLPINGEDLRTACDSVLVGEAVAAEQRPSIGCNIKWKSDSTPDYFTGQSAE